MLPQHHNWGQHRGSQEICLRLFGERHGTLALGGLALARCFRAEGAGLMGAGGAAGCAARAGGRCGMGCCMVESSRGDGDGVVAGLLGKNRTNQRAGWKAEMIVLFWDLPISQWVRQTCCIHLLSRVHCDAVNRIISHHFISFRVEEVQGFLLESCDFQWLECSPISSSPGFQATCGMPSPAMRRVWTSSVRRPLRRRRRWRSFVAAVVVGWLVGWLAMDQY